MAIEFKKRIEIVSRHTGESLEGLSVRAGLDRSYLRKVMERDDPQPRRSTLRKMANAWNVSLNWLDDGTGEIDDLHDGSSQNPLSTSLAPVGPPPQIPIRGRTGHQYFGGERSDEYSKIGSVPAVPPTLFGIAGMYALYVGDRSMEPQFFPGDLIFLNPARPPRIGECAVILADTEAGPERSLGIFSNEDSETITLKKRNEVDPAATDIVIRKENIRNFHKVLNINEIFGV